MFTLRHKGNCNKLKKKNTNNTYIHTYIHTYIYVKVRKRRIRIDTRSVAWELIPLLAL